MTVQSLTFIRFYNSYLLLHNTVNPAVLNLISIPENTNLTRKKIVYNTAYLRVICFGIKTYYLQNVKIFYHNKKRRKRHGNSIWHEMPYLERNLNVFFMREIQVVCFVIFKAWGIHQNPSYICGIQLELWTNNIIWSIEYNQFSVKNWAIYTKNRIFELRQVWNCTWMCKRKTVVYENNLSSYYRNCTKKSFFTRVIFKMR